MSDKLSSPAAYAEDLEKRIAELEEDNQRLQDTIKAQVSTIFDAKAETDRLSRILETQTQTIIRQQKHIEEMT